MVNYKTCRTGWLDSKKDVKDKAAILRSKALELGKISGSLQSLECFAKIWLEKHAFANKVYSAAIRDEAALRVHILPRIGSVQLRNLSAGQIDFVFADLKTKTKLAPKTINNILATLKRMLNDAVKWGHITNNPAQFITHMKINIQREITLSDDEVDKFLSFVKRESPRMYDLVVFALNTGCRLGECVSLAWQKVDLKDGFVIIDRTYDSRLKQHLLRTKGKRFRKVPLNKTCTAMLQRLKLESGSDESDLVFKSISYDYVTHELFKRLLFKCGLTSALERGVTFHSLRHTFATKFMRQSGNIYELQHVLGHSTIKQTERYSHCDPTFLKGCTESITFEAKFGQVVSLNPSLPRNLPARV